jgi:hypothetical protein
MSSNVPPNATNLLYAPLPTNPSDFITSTRLTPSEQLGMQHWSGIHSPSGPRLNPHMERVVGYYTVEEPGSTAPMFVSIVIFFLIMAVTVNIVGKHN